MISRGIAGAALGLSLLAGIAGSQEPAQSGAILRADTNLVLVPTSVSDPMNRPVTGLEKENFRVFDNGVEQTVTQFAMEDEPLALGLIYDVSGSMGKGLGKSRVAAQKFFQTANREDEFFLIEFDDRPRLVVPLGPGLGRLQEDLVFSKSSGSTALIDAVVMGLHEVKKSKLTRKALLIISDGGENNSRYTLKEMRNMVLEGDALIYAILVEDQERDGPWYLRQMTEDSGGRVVPYGQDAIDPITKISVELRNRYLLGFSPSSETRDGRYHNLKVMVVPPRGLPKLQASWRKGYYAAQD
jgi:VWFA-related protein